MVESSACCTYQIYAGESFNIVDGPSYGLCLVVMFLLVFIDDDIGLSLLHGRGEGIHVPDDKVGSALLSEYRPACTQIFDKCPVAAYGEVC